MRIYAVLDTNVLVSSLYTKNHLSATVRIMDALRARAFRTVYNNDIINEYGDVLSREKFGFKQQLIDDIITIVKDNGIRVGRTPTDEFFSDKDDVVFYEVALSKEGTYVVTGNKRHFPETPIVVTPAEMVKILEDAGLIEKIGQQ